MAKFLAILLLFLSPALFAETSPEWIPVAGEVSGTLLRHGKPVQGASIIGCHDAWKSAWERDCKAFEVKTDADGKFLFRQINGTVYRANLCPVKVGCEPAWVFDFTFLVDGKSAKFRTAGIGNGLTKLVMSCNMVDSDAEIRGQRLEIPSPDAPNTKSLFMSCERNEAKFYERPARNVP